MNHIKWPIVLLLVANLVVPALSLASEDTGEWVIIHDIEIEHSTFAAGFMDENFGITVGYAGEIHYTTDGGETWPEAVNTSLCRFGLDIIDEHIAWHVGNGGNVRLSTDGGQTWQAVEDVKDHGISRYVSFLDEQTGWVSNGEALWLTDDGGQSWQDIVIPEEVKVISAVNLVTPEQGAFLDIAGNLYLTEDGGVTWVAQPLPLDKDRRFTVMILPAMRFQDGDHGLIVGRTKSDETIALRTEDGGENWSEEAIPIDEIGSTGMFYLSHDGLTLTFTDENRVIVAQYQTD